MNFQPPPASLTTKPSISTPQRSFQKPSLGYAVSSMIWRMRAIFTASLSASALTVRGMPHSEPSGMVPPRSEPTGVAMVCHQPIVLPVLPVPFSDSLASTPGYQAKPYLPANSAGLRSFQEIVYQSGSISFSLTIVRTSIRNCSLSPLTIGCVTALSSIPKVCSAAHICSRLLISPTPALLPAEVNA